MQKSDWLHKVEILNEKGGLGAAVLSLYKLKKII